MKRKVDSDKLILKVHRFFGPKFRILTFDKPRKGDVRFRVARLSAIAQVGHVVYLKINEKYNYLECVLDLTKIYGKRKEPKNVEDERIKELEKRYEVY